MSTRRRNPSVVARARRAPALVASFLPRSLLRRHGATSLVAFVHIPKTAGATVTSMFVASYSRGEVRDAGNQLTSPERSPAKLGRRQWAGARVMAGHVPYGIYREHLPPDTRYITFLREPVDRVLSHYYRHIQRRDPRRAGSPKDLASGKLRANSLEEALVEMRLPALNNLATRFLCNDPSPADLPASALDDAKANLREFAFFGIQERFEESVVLLQQRLGLDPVPYLNRHISIDRPTVEEISAEQRALIEERNQLDAELYAFALGLFADAVAAADAGFAAAVETLRALSADLNEEAIQKARDWLDRELPAGTTRPRAALYAAAEAAGIPVPVLKHILGSRREDAGSPRAASGRAS